MNWDLGDLQSPTVDATGLSTRRGAGEGKRDSGRNSLRHSRNESVCRNTVSVGQATPGQQAAGAGAQGSCPPRSKRLKRAMFAGGGSQPE